MGRFSWRWLLAAALLAVQIGLALPARPAWAVSDSCYYRLVVSAVASAQQLTDCIRAQQAGLKRHGATAEGAKYLFRLGRLYERLFEQTDDPADLNTALNHYRRLAKRYPKSKLADDSLYHLGRLLLSAKGDKVGAYVAFLRIELAYPQGDMAEAAKVERAKLAQQIKKLEADKAERRARRDATGQAVASAGRGVKGDGTRNRPGRRHFTSAKHRRRRPAQMKPTPAFEPPEAKPARKLTGDEVVVTGLRHWSAAGYTRVVVDVTGPVKFKSHLLRPDPDLGKPARLFLDLENARLDSHGEKEISIADGHLRRARLGQYDANTVRVVLDIQTIDGYKAFELHSPNRVVIDVSGPRVAAKAETGPGERPTIPADPRKGKGIKVPRGKARKQAGKGLAVQLGLGVRTVVIDPGHGGRDPGTRTCRGLKEKDITLKIALKLARLLRQKLGLKVVLTRTKDVYLPLEERTAIANTSQADLFISIHVNAARNRRLSGVETYFLNLATDERAITLAARENATSTKSISDLQSILNDLMLNTKINESNRLAFQTQRQLVATLRRAFPGTRSLGVKQAPFYVLLGARMPAILVEVGFGTNSTECYRLGKDRYLNRLAIGLFKGVAAYIKQIKSGV